MHGNFAASLISLNVNIFDKNGLDIKKNRPKLFDGLTSIATYACFNADRNLHTNVFS